MILDQVRAQLTGHFGTEPDSATVTFLGVQPFEVLRYRAPAVDIVDFWSLGCSRHPMTDPAAVIVDPSRGPRAEVGIRLRDPAQINGLARSLAMIAAAPAVEGVVLVADALIDLGSPLWTSPSGPVAFTAVLLGASDIPDLELASQDDLVRFLTATPVTATEAAWIRLKGAAAMRQTWSDDRVDVLDPRRADRRRQGR